MSDSTKNEEVKSYLERYGNKVIDTRLLKDTKFVNYMILNSSMKIEKKSICVFLKNVDEYTKFISNEGIIYNLLRKYPHPYTTIMDRYEYITYNDKKTAVFVGLSDIEGPSMYNSINRVIDMDIKSKVKLFLQITSAFAHCHSLGIIFKNISIGKFFFTDLNLKKIVLADLLSSKIIKNENVLNPGKALVSDRTENDLYRNENIRFVAPENIKFNSYDAFASNVYALGVIFFTIMIGHYPIISTDPQEMVSKILSGDINWSKVIPKEIEQLLKSMLNINPLERPTAVSILNNEIFKDIVDELGISQFKKNTPFSLTSNPTVIKNIINPFTTKTNSIADATTSTKYTCPICQHVFQRQAIMYSHMHSAHPQRGRGKITQSEKK